MKYTYREANESTLARAMKRALKTLKSDAACVACAEDAGFIMDPKYSAALPTGYQVFVKVCPYSQLLQNEDPMSGGLYAHITPKKETLVASANRNFGHVVAALDGLLAALETNAPIHEAEGNTKQARLERKTAREIRKVILKLGE